MHKTKKIKGMFRAQVKYEKNRQKHLQLLCITACHKNGSFNHIIPPYFDVFPFLALAGSSNYAGPYFTL